MNIGKSEMSTMTFNEREVTEHVVRKQQQQTHIMTRTCCEMADQN